MTDDPRYDVALYALPEAARLLRVPSQTLRNWVTGYRYPSGSGPVMADPVILTPRGELGLSFLNLVEALTLAGFREIGVPMQRVRKALAYAGAQAGIDHLLASERILSDGVDLFWQFQEHAEAGAQLVNVSKGGQKAFPEAVLRYLQGVEWGKDRFAVRWWPGAVEAKKGAVVVDPRRSFGAPVLAGTGIRVEDVFGRFSAGESMAELAKDYGLHPDQVESAIRLEASLLEPIAA